MGSEGVNCEAGKNLYKVCEREDRAEEEWLSDAEWREGIYLLIVLTSQLQRFSQKCVLMIDPD